MEGCGTVVFWYRLFAFAWHGMAQILHLLWQSGLNSNLPVKHFTSDCYRIGYIILLLLLQLKEKFNTFYFIGLNITLMVRRIGLFSCFSKGC